MSSLIILRRACDEPAASLRRACDDAVEHGLAPRSGALIYKKRDITTTQHDKNRRDISLENLTRRGPLARRIDPRQ